MTWHDTNPTREHELPPLAIARECGILTDDGIAIEGPEFQEKSEEEMLKIIPKHQVISSFVFMEHLQVDWITR